MLVVDAVQNIVVFILWIVLLGVKAYAFIDCLRRPAQAFPAVDRQSKTLWMILTGVALLTGLLMNQTLGLIGIAAAAVAIIYLVDVRTKIQSITGQR